MHVAGYSSTTVICFARISGAAFNESSELAKSQKYSLTILNGALVERSERVAITRCPGHA